MKLCAYIAGDKNIIYPAIVSLLSVIKYNSELDLFLFTDSKAVNKEQTEFCKKNNINIVDLSVIDEDGRMHVFKDMQRWPKEVFYNYIIPYYLTKFSYKYAIKLDYDTLCCYKFKYEDILPNDSECLSIILKGSLNKYLNSTDLNLVQNITNLKKFNEFTSVNTGVFVINVKSYLKLDIFTYFRNIYSYIKDLNISLDQETLEQWAFGAVQCCINHKYKKLPVSYNFRPTPLVDNMNIIHVVHFSTVFKPWKEIDIDKLVKEEVKVRGFSFFKQIIFYNRWKEFANSLNFKQFNYDSAPLSDLFIYNIYAQIKRYQINTDKQRKTLLDLSSSIQGYLSLSSEFYFSPVFEPSFNYCQFKISSNNSVHYELNLFTSYVSFSIHFEKEYCNSNYPEKLCKIFPNFILEIHKNRKSVVLFKNESINNKEILIHKISEFINQTYPFLKFYI